jgi:hypothetical protein
MVYSSTTFGWMYVSVLNGSCVDCGYASVFGCWNINCLSMI